MVLDLIVVKILFPVIFTAQKEVPQYFPQLCIRALVYLLDQQLGIEAIVFLVYSVQLLLLAHFEHCHADREEVGGIGVVVLDFVVDLHQFLRGGEPITQVHSFRRNPRVT